MSNGGQEYTVKAGDTLIKLAREFYNNASYWRAIELATNAKADDDDSFTFIEDPNLIRPGQKLWIPGAEEAARLVEEYHGQQSLPPDPSTVAPELDQTVATDLATATEFLYTGSSPIQTEVAPGTIKPIRVAVIRGRLLRLPAQEGDDDPDPLPLSGVNITVLGHPEFGQTLSRADGMFDLAVNGGGPLTLNYVKEGYLPAQRQVHVPWQDYVWAPDVVLVTLDPAATEVDLRQAAEPFLVAQGSPVEDADGRRRATLLFPQGVQAAMVVPNRPNQSLSTMTVRATEYTVGKNGPKAMPAELPPASGYTYAVEISADEAQAAGATDVHFDQPLYFYVEDFIGFPVGSPVPTGYYNREKGQWIASENGRVIKILSITDGLADLDTTGDGFADEVTTLEELGITAAERAKLAGLYANVPQQVWRVPIKHFTPWDCNWGFGPPGGAAPPSFPEPETEQVEDENCETGNSIIEAQNQTLGERIPITGTPFTLDYRSDRVPGRRLTNSNISLNQSSIPTNVKQIELNVAVAGQNFSQSFPAETKEISFTSWDGKDAYGRTLRGKQPSTIKVGYTYDGVYQQAERFGYSGPDLPITGSRTRQEVTLWQGWHGNIEALGGMSEDLGTWTLNIHHVYDPKGRKLYLGDGGRRSATATTGQTIATVAGNGNMGFAGDGGQATEAQLNSPSDIALGPDGSLYITDQGNHRIRKVDPQGIITTVAGNGTPGYNGENIPAIAANLNSPSGLDVGPDGSLYIADGMNYRVRKVDPHGIITSVAGNGTQGPEGEVIGDGGPAEEAQFNTLTDVALGPDGNLYISDPYNCRVRKVDTDGIIITVAGNGQMAATIDPSDSRPATQVPIGWAGRIVIGSDGTLYIHGSLIEGDITLQVTPDGILSRIVAIDANGRWIDGIVALDQNNRPYLGDYHIIEGSGGRTESVYLIDSDGTPNLIAGGGIPGYSGDGGPATKAQINFSGIAVGPDGSLYMADRKNHRIRKVTPVLPGFSVGDIFLPSEDGSEVYIFDHTGRHLRTVNALTGATIYQFEYDNGQLIKIKDGDGNLTTIERDSDGTPKAIIAPFGQRTDLTLNNDGYLEKITDPAGQAYDFTYEEGGLLKTITDPRRHTSDYSYDDLGRLTKAEDATDGEKNLERSGTHKDTTVRLITGMLRETAYRTLHLPSGETRRETTCCGGTKTVMESKPDGSRTLTDADDTVTTLQQGPDPRFGMQAPLIESVTTKTPSGLESTVKMQRQVSLSDPNDLFSLLQQTDIVTINDRSYRSVVEAATNEVTTTTPEGRQHVTKLDEQGRVVEERVANLEPVRYTYDEHGRLETIVQGTAPAERKIALAYDGDGQVASITDSSDSLPRTVSFEYDQAGRVTGQTTNPGNLQIGYGYDDNGNLTSITPPGRPAHAFEYNKVNLEETYTPPNVDGAGTNQTHYRYNRDRQLTRIERPDDQTIELKYDDAAGRLEELILPRGTTKYEYNQTTGNLTDITAPDGGKLTFAYDGSLLTRTAWQEGLISGQVERTYDKNFRIRSRCVNGGPPIEFTYDKDGLLTQAGDLSLARDALNGLITHTSLGQVADTREHNLFAELTNYRATYSGTELLAVTYTRDKLGRITGKTETINDDTTNYIYEYNEAGRLEAVKKNGAVVASYTYDDNGNRRSYTDAGGTVISGQYDDQDRLLQYGDITYQYTANGELQGKTNTATNETTTYDYDLLGNLIRVNLPGADGTEIEYLIDGLNRRIGKKVNGELVQGFLYKDQLNPIAELDGNGQVVARFIYGSKTNVPDYMIKAEQTYRIISDHLGSPRLVIDIASGQVLQQLDYDAFGNVLADTNPGFQPFGFAGGIYDQHTKLTRFGTRDYDAQVGRWMAKDLIRFTGLDTNLYRYAFDDPINRIDPSGAFPPLLLLIASGMVLGASTTFFFSGNYLRWQNLL